MTDPDWRERIIAAAEGRLLQAQHVNVQPFHVQVHENQQGNKPFALKVRPRAGVWAPFFAFIPNSEKDIVQPNIMTGLKDAPTNSGMLTNCGEGTSPDGALWIINAGNQSTPTESYYVWCNKLPSTLVFGVNGRAPKYTINFCAQQGTIS